jgi:hypothetical protein
MTDIARAYAMGRNAAHRGGVISEPRFDRAGNVTEEAQWLAIAFWNGVHDLKAEDRLNREEW